MSTLTLPATGTWSLDTAHTTVGFKVKHLMAARVRGSFRTFSGTINVADPVENSSVNVTIDAASIDTGASDRDHHLRSPDFLDVENFPTLEFNSNTVRVTGDGYAVDGELTIRGESRPVTLDMEFAGVIQDPWGNEKAIFSASTKINREDWGLTWNAPLEAGGWLVGKEVTIEIELEAAKA
ncbi:MAG: YceI family protein [Acidimicrobiia bacterium]